ncbi:hypothetical protein HYH03_005867 [Edaphochlamys debaryana]|uniref:Uncharacterized protein n=1 Tax=Edaphochlamys debaryana TaxID=47281 RepID=A0A835Y836_9CHLO|nr:hypothetical protein HYH03_005867 [Edaphochlamys debaryana]|eukprot:KAG2495936.1 hypothetical protein HYH03_005867 [Edaphochlamys debaryana]
MLATPARSSLRSATRASQAPRSSVVVRASAPPPSRKDDAAKASPKPETKPADTKPTAGSADGKKKGAWQPEFPSLVNNKPLPTEDVKTNIDM